MGARNAGRLLAFAFGTVALVTASIAPADGATVYRCTQPDGRTLYTDAPCKGGAVVDLRSGTANDAAIERLDRDNAAFDNRMAARAATEQATALRRRELELRERELQARQTAAAAAQAAPSAGYLPYGYALPYMAHGRTRRQAHPAPPPAPAGRVPAEIRRPHPG